MFSKLISFLRTQSVNSIRLTLFAFVALMQQGITKAMPDGEMQHSMFSGSLIQPGEGDGEILRRFEADLYTNGSEHFFCVSDDHRAGCPWPDSFGLTGSEVPAEKVQPHLVYNYDGTIYLINLPPFVTTLPAVIAPNSTWEHDGWQMTAIEEQTLDGIPVWIVDARERRGRQQSLTVEASSGITLRAEADVFMGQGDQFRLTLARSSSKQMEPKESTQLSELKGQLLSLQSALKRRPDSHGYELSQRQVDDVLAGIEQTTRLSKGTPLEDLVRRMRTDAEQQQKRLSSAASRANALMNSDAPAFILDLVTGTKLDSASLKGKTVVLHFWDYRDAPLSEPYGQTGYLEFLFNQKMKMNVEVVGISTNPDLQTAENIGRGRRSARKLSEFMNLTYPIGHDNGALLKSFGDPRDSKGQLPLWIVVSPEGKVTHYHAGFYEVDASQGLKELETVLSELIRTRPIN